VASTLEIRPQPGPQELALASTADIAIMGGGAFGGKTWALTIEPLRHVNNPAFSTVYFRRTYPELTNPGGVWDEMRRWYPLLGAKSNRSDLVWTFPSGMRVQCSHLQWEDSVDSWAGAQVPLINFDQLEQFTERQFWFLLSRNRSASGVKGYVRATCNPDPDSFVAKLVEWWINDEGYAIPDRAGKIRYFVRIADTLYWADDKRDLMLAFPTVATEEDPPKSLTFIPALIDDNKIGLAANPGYKASLRALPLVDQERLLKGNWKIRPAAGKVFNKDWFELVDSFPLEGAFAVRFFDTAGTEKKLASDDPDYTAGVLVIKAGPSYYVADCIAQQIGPAAVEQLMLDTAKSDAAWCKERNIGYRFAYELEPGSAALRDANRIIRELAGISVGVVRPSGDKLVRARALASQCQPLGSVYGNVKVVRGAWNEQWLNHMHNVPDGKHDDIMDASAGAFNEVTQYAPVPVEKGQGVVRLRR
jgi:predicted phage terminase large subunit-like protein